VDILLLVLHVVLSLGIITLVLLQKGAGASAGAAFGGGGAGSVFGATGSANFLSKTTAIFAIGFFINSLVLAYLAANRDVQTDSVLDALMAPATESVVPAADSTSEGAEVPLADIPAADESEISADDVPSPETADVPPAADMPPADVPQPAGE
jgi:preprotein translocase subunit SecG